MLMSDLGSEDLKEIQKALDGWTGTAAEKKILFILERASGDSQRLNYVIQRCNLAKIIDDLNDGLVFNSRTALMELFSGPLLPLLDSKSKELICLELKKRDGSLEQETLDHILLSNSRAAFESSDLGLAWLKAHHRAANSMKLSSELLDTDKTGSLAHAEAKEGAGVGMLQELGAYLLSLFPQQGAGVRLEDLGTYFNDYLGLLGLDAAFRSRLDFAGHKELYPDAASFVNTIISGLQANPIIAAFAEEWSRQPASFKARSRPPPSPARDEEIVKAIVYCFFLDIMTHSMMFEKPVYVEPVLAEGETLMETVLRVSTKTLLLSDWWQYLSFTEQLELGGWGLLWERDFCPFKRTPLPAEGLAQSLGLGKARIFEEMFENLLQACDDAAETGLALVLGSMDAKAVNILSELGLSAWKETVMPPRGNRANAREQCRLGFGSETTALPVVWENLFVSWWLGSCADEPDAIMHFASTLAPLAGSFYREKEGRGHFLAFRTPMQWLHTRISAMDKAQRKQRECPVDWRAPQAAILWSKVNNLAAKQYITRLENIVNKLPTKYASVLKAGMEKDHMAWGKVKSTSAKYHDFENMPAGSAFQRLVSGRSNIVERKSGDNSKQTSTLFWQTMGTLYDPAVPAFEQIIFKLANRKFKGATAKVHVVEPEEKELVRRLANGLIDPAYYNQKLKEAGTPLLEDLLFDKKNARTKALANQTRVGTLLVFVQSVALTIPKPSSKMYCVLESALTPRDGQYQGAIKTSQGEGVWKQSFLIPISPRRLDNGFDANLTIELWSSNPTCENIVGTVAFTLADIQKREVNSLPLDPTTLTAEPFPFLSDIGSLLIGMCYLPVPQDELSDYKEHSIPDELLRVAWPGTLSFSHVSAPDLRDIREVFSALSPQMKTGDLILWASSLHKGDMPTRWMNSAVTGATNSIYTHAAFVFVAEHPETKERHIYHVESGVNRLFNTDCIAKTPFRNSIFVTDLGERLENYGATMVYLPLLNSLSAEQHERLSRFAAHMWLRDPTFDSTQLVSAGLQKTLGRFPTPTEDWTRCFCSEFCSASFKLAGLPQFQQLNTSTLPPADVASQSGFARQRFVLSALPEHLADAAVAADKEFTRKVVERSKVNYS